MEEKEYTIRITGSGTFKEISKALLSVAEEMELIIDDRGEPTIPIVKWEDPILMTEIKEED